MKKRGSICQFERERNADLMRAYNEEIKGRKHIFLPDVFKAVVKKPSARFWVSERRAAIVLSQLFNGDDALDRMRPLKRRMFREIYRRAVKLHHNYPQLTFLQLAEYIVQQPAPEFYLTPGSAKVIVSKIKKRQRKESKRK
jgi:hypothetical protein